MADVIAVPVPQYPAACGFPLPVYAAWQPLPGAYGGSTCTTYSSPPPSHSSLPPSPPSHIIPCPPPPLSYDTRFHYDYFSTTSSTRLLLDKAESDDAATNSTKCYATVTSDRLWMTSPNLSSSASSVNTSVGSTTCPSPPVVLDLSCCCSSRTSRDGEQEKGMTHKKGSIFF
jgi:hypothetical protein